MDCLGNWRVTQKAFCKFISPAYRGFINKFSDSGTFSGTGKQSSSLLVSFVPGFMVLGQSY